MIQSLKRDLQALARLILLKFCGKQSNHIALQLNCSTQSPFKEFYWQVLQNGEVHLIETLLITLQPPI